MRYILSEIKRHNRYPGNYFPNAEQKQLETVIYRLIFQLLSAAAAISHMDRVNCFYDSTCSVIACLFSEARARNVHLSLIAEQ